MKINNLNYSRTHICTSLVTNQNISAFDGRKKWASFFQFSLEKNHKIRPKGPFSHNVESPKKREENITNRKTANMTMTPTTKKKATISMARFFCQAIRCAKPQPVCLNTRHIYSCELMYASEKAVLFLSRFIFFSLGIRNQKKLQPTKNHGVNKLIVAIQLRVHCV